ncbi:MAG: NUDIX domain-containing protein [bacterium]|nr:NUDIX domain-containing protein [bacterium]
MPTDQFLHEVAITAIIVKDNKYLITRRSASKKRFPGMWTVPGGKLETSDYLSLEKDTEHYWYNVLERTLRREVKEEVGLDIERIEYLTSLATVHGDGNPSLVISCVADWASGNVALKKDESDDFAWVTSEEAKHYPLIDGIHDELAMADRKRAGERLEWSRTSGKSISS